jgi:hypothetical protein
LLYLQQADYNLDEAIGAYKSDERWEIEHPLEAVKKGKSKASTATPTTRRKWGFSGGLAGQI